MIELLLLPFFVGCIVAMAAAPLGAFVMWNRLVYFGETLAHSALLGVAFAIIINIHPAAGIAFASLSIAFILWLMQSQTTLANDTLLGIISHSALALGLVGISLLSDARVDLYAYLFGDLLTVTTVDLLLILGTAISIFICLIIFWRPLLMITIDKNLAQVEGIRVEQTRLILMILIALLIGIAMKVVGILLITALLIIPVATARKLARSPEALVICAAIIGVCAVGVGLISSYYFDTPPGASIVLSSTVFFIVASVFSHTKA